MTDMTNKINRMVVCVGSVKTQGLIDRDLADGSKKRYDFVDDNSPTNRTDVKNIMVDQDPEYGQTQEP